MTNRTIVVGIDSSTEAGDALEWARRFAEADDRIVAVRAWEIPVTPGAFEPSTVYPLDFEELARRELEQQLCDVSDDRVVPVIRHDRPGHAIIEESTSADLVVVGHRGDGRVSLMLGSTANYVVHRSTCPVVVVRGDQPVAPRRVVVGVDDFDMTQQSTSGNASVRALQFAYGVPGVEEIHVVHSWFLPPLTFGSFITVPLDMAEFDQAAQAVLDHVTEAAGPPPTSVKVTTEVVRDSAPKALIDASKQADLVVVGSRGRGGFKGLLLGSTSAEVLSHSHTSVAVIR